jgi:hypothetical protein
VPDEWWTGSAREARTEATRKAYVRLVDVVCASLDFWALLILCSFFFPGA